VLAAAVLAAAVLVVASLVDELEQAVKVTAEATSISAAVV